MNKELTPLEALSNLFKYACNYKVNEKHRLGNSKEWKDIVKNALYDLTRLQELFNQYAEDNKRMREYIDMVDKTFVDVETTKKKLKALEIIRNKQVAVDELLMCIEEEENPLEEFSALEEYNNFAGDENSLTQEEFDLLKEVLL